ncbi:MAG: hypothetical protein WCO25_06255 [Candidatus Uhrbacteria bacterium]
MQPKNDPGGKRRGGVSELRAERAIRERIGNPSWLLAVRRPTDYEDLLGVDLACRTEGVGEICVQVKSSDNHAKKFLNTYRSGLRGAVPIAVIVVRDLESNASLGERIVAAVGTLRDEILTIGRDAWIARMEREFILCRVRKFRMTDLDVEAAYAFMLLAEQLTEPWPLWLEAFHHGNPEANDHPVGVVCLDTNVGLPICLFPSRCPERVERLRRAIGDEPPGFLALLPVRMPEGADVAWLDEAIASKVGKRYRRIAKLVAPLVRRR